jgi:histidyl-tRNA synthetase
MSDHRIQAIKGMNDLLPEQAPLWQHLEATARRVFGLYGFEEVRTPVVESTALFVRGIGEETDVVGKEMYTFEDRGGESIALRPEGTAGAVRAYVEHSRHAIDPIQKWFYIGPMFRGEQPQKGRYRQFHQVGAELFGVAEPRADVELIAGVHRFLAAAGVKDVVLRLNSLGDAESRPAYREALVRHFEPHASRLSETDRRRLEKNPLRLLDSKDPVAVELSRGAPSTLDHLSPASRAHFDAVLAGLTAIGVPYEVDPRIVRGLDYYTRTTFEFVATQGLGSQSTVAGGGRYDGMVEQLGGPATPAIGFALGLERLAILLESQAAALRRGPDLFLGVLGDTAGLAAMPVAEACRSRGLSVELTLKSTGVAKQFKRADRLQARYAAVIGEGELASGAVRLKTMATGEEREVRLDALAATLAHDLGYGSPSGGGPE